MNLLQIILYLSLICFACLFTFTWKTWNSISNSLVNRRPASLPKYFAHHQSNRTQCRSEQKGGLLILNTTAPSWKELNHERVRKIQPGGRFKPEGCNIRDKVALIIPFRDRDEHLRVFLNHMHPFLQRQGVEYKVYVINQTGMTAFNRGALFNVGFIEALNDDPEWHCIVFHDVDLIPEIDLNSYKCHEWLPRHMSVAVDTFDYELPYKKIFGGVSSMTTELFRRLNGFSNRYWGWGGEDDDMWRRIEVNGYNVHRYKGNVARYTMLGHEKAQKNPDRKRILKEGAKNFLTEGLNNLEYEVTDVAVRPLYTTLSVDLSEMYRLYRVSIMHMKY